MDNYIRYGLATLFFAASVGCLALWGASISTRHFVHYREPTRIIWVEVSRGYVKAVPLQGAWKLAGLDIIKRYQSAPISTDGVDLESAIELHGRFGGYGNTTYFPIWYPALIFALAGVAALRFRRQFSIRSAMIRLSVVAALLGLVVAL